MRILGGLALVALVMVGAVFVGMPIAFRSWTDEGNQSIVATVAAGAIGVSITAFLALFLFQLRFRQIVRAAERLARRELGVEVKAPERGRGLEGRLARAVNAISAALSETTDEATNDKLTGVANRRALLVELFNEVERANRYERPLSVAFVDIDHFKAVNDTYGHAAGDVVLRGVAQTIEKNLRATDMVGRYGGEEFMLILTETNVEEGAVLTEKLRTLVAREHFAVEGNPALSVTISIGIAGGAGSRLSSDTLVRDADAAMYSAKSLGRNQTYIFAEPDEDARIPRAPISAAGRARALEIGQAARDAATASLTAVVSPLPHYGGQPSPLIATIVVAMARNLALPQVEVDRIRVAALLHDVGKVAVPQEILDKPSALTSAEWRSVVQHPRIGQVILEQAAALKDAVPIILHHHERFSGHGYPFGLRLPVRPPRQRHPARCTDRRDCRCLRRDDPRPPVQAGDEPRQRDRRAPPPCRDPVRPGPRQPVLRPLRPRRSDARPVDRCPNGDRHRDDQHGGRGEAPPASREGRRDAADPPGRYRHDRGRVRRRLSHVRRADGPPALLYSRPQRLPQRRTSRRSAVARGRRVARPVRRARVFEPRGGTREASIYKAPECRGLFCCPRPRADEAAE
jgi:diguanylate cyclase (GGDEF)-like protein